MGAVWWRTLRPVFFWTHLAAGLVAGGVILIMSVTGVLLTYQKQMTTWADLRGLNGGPPSSQSTALSADSLIALVSNKARATPTTVIWRAERNTPVEMALPKGRRVFVNAYSGEILGEGSTTMRAFFRQVTDWHRWLAMGGESRAQGRAITGASNIAFLVLALSGVWLWWPKQRTRAAFRNILFFRQGLRAKARDFNWHNVLGAWSFTPLLIVVASGVVISYGWAGDLVYRVAGETPPARGAPEAATRTRVTALPVALPVAFALEKARASRSDWRSISLTMAARADGARAFSIDAGMGGEPQKRAQFTVLADSSVKFVPFAEQTRGRRWRTVLRFAHTGEVLGVLGQTVAGLASLAGVVLVYTGFALSWRRWRQWRKRATIVRGLS